MKKAVNGKAAALPEDWKPKKFPKSLGACIDLAYTLRAQRLEVQHTVESLKADEHKLREHLSAKFKWSEINGAIGAIASASVKSEECATVEDPIVFFQWVYKQKPPAFDLLYKACSNEAARLRWGEGIDIPGVNKFIAQKISLTKVRKSTSKKK
jgi:hypothetical protein